LKARNSGNAHVANAPLSPQGLPTPSPLEKSRTSSDLLPAGPRARLAAEPRSQRLPGRGAAVRGQAAHLLTAPSLLLLCQPTTPPTALHQLQQLSGYSPTSFTH